jgi:hypothetical protein
MTNKVHRKKANAEPDSTESGFLFSPPATFALSPISPANVTMP